MIYDISNSKHRQIPISAADRALIDSHEAEVGITHVAMGVSGMTIEDDRKAAFWQTKRRRQSAAFQLQQARRQQLYCNLAADGKSRKEIATIVGVNIDAVYKAIRRQRLQIRPMFGADSDG